MKLLEWLHENGERILLGTMAVIALVVSILVISIEWLHLREHIPAGSLILLATFVLFFLLGYERHIRKITSSVADYKILVEKGLASIAEQGRKWEQMGIREIYRSRDDPGQKRVYTSLLDNATSAIFIVGVTLRDVTHDQYPKLFEKATTGCSIQLLILTPEHWKNEHPTLDPIAHGNLKNHFRSSRRCCIKQGDDRAGILDL